MTTTAEKLFELSRVKFDLAVQLDDAGVVYEDIGWDYYDNSLELRGVPNDLRLSEDAQRVIHGAGFSKVYVFHKAIWETHYSFKEIFALSAGWRISYPHKRGDGDGAIWVEKIVTGWPREWFENGKCVVKAPSNAL